MTGIEPIPFKQYVANKFNKYDTDQDNRISLEELRAAYEECAKENPNGSTAIHLSMNKRDEENGINLFPIKLNVRDANENGTLEFNEFMGSHIESAFSLIDKNNPYFKGPFSVNGDNVADPTEEDIKAFNALGGRQFSLTKEEHQGEIMKRNKSMGWTI